MIIYGQPVLNFASFEKLDTLINCLQKFLLIDTAGIRRRAVVASSGSTTEALSVNRAFRAVRRSDVVALIIEAMACVTEQVICFQSLRSQVLQEKTDIWFDIEQRAG